MIVYVYPLDPFGCGHYRLVYPAAAVQLEGGLDVRIMGPTERHHLGGVAIGDEMQSATCPPDADVIVYQRPTGYFLAQTVRLLRKRGVAVVVDMDDDLRHIHPSNPAWWGLHPRRDRLNNWEHAELACRHASLVTVSTPALAKRYGGHGRVRVLPNCVPGAALAIPRPGNERPVVGWPGSLHSHPDDLREASAALHRLAADGVPVRVVGSGEGVERQLGPAAEATGLIEFGDWLPAIARLDVGVAPLADTIFNASKSWLKPLELASVGVAPVSSDLPEYRRLAELGAGLIAEKRRDWLRLIRRLVDDDGYRADVADRGREAAAGLTYEANAWRWAEAWSDALATERGGDPAREEAARGR